MNRDHTNNLFGIVKFSAIFIAMFQGKIIFDLRSENFKLNESLTESKASAARSEASAAKIEGDNLSEIEQVFTLKKEVTIFPGDRNVYLRQDERVTESTQERIHSIKQKIELLQSTKDRNLELEQKIKKLEQTNEYLTNKLTESKYKPQSSDEQTEPNAKAVSNRKKLLTTNHFWSLVMGKTRTEVTKVMGKPDDMKDLDDGGKFTSSWVYENRIKHPGSSRSEKGGNAKISFDDEVVDNITFE